MVFLLLLLLFSESFTYFEMVQQIFSDRKRRSDHHLRDVLRTRPQSETVGFTCETEEEGGGTYPTGQDAERPLVDVHYGVVFPFVAIHLLKMKEKESGNSIGTRRRRPHPADQRSPDQSAVPR